MVETECILHRRLITTGIFVSIVAWASFQRKNDKTPYWRTLKANGELNAKYPGGIEAQKEMLEKEGHTVIQKGRKNIRWLRCPVCGNKTRNRVREDTVLKNYPLYCPKCKREMLINVKQLNMSVITEPDA